MLMFRHFLLLGVLLLRFYCHFGFLLLLRLRLLSMLRWAPRQHHHHNNNHRSENEKEKKKENCVNLLLVSLFINSLASASAQPTGIIFDYLIILL
ncbi:hypothetical protein T492DRAFT_960859 [Pavlovales sp. CCMP2436]|nr:hypothetical protein T492DRAFT_960859 [Pavlovales sp. CCMP2436]